PSAPRLYATAASTGGLPVIAGVDDSILDPDRKARDGFGRRRLLHLAGAHVEASAVTRTFDLEAADFTCRELATVVGAGVLDGIQVALEVVHRDRGVVIPHDAKLARQQFVPGTDFYPFFCHVLSPGPVGEPQLGWIKPRERRIRRCAP